jgi:hypothetical protein
MNVRTGLFRYCRWQDLPARERAGWMFVADLGATHGVWSCLIWHCECGQ